MPHLQFGVNDIPYSQALTAQERRTVRWRQGLRPWQSIRGQQTTGDVAEWLERRYGVMQFFVDEHGDDMIVPALENMMVGQLENLLMGGPIRENVFEEGDFSSIEQAFRKMLDAKELDGRVAGVPTMAAQMGVSHRFSHPYARRASRPSFIDTGLYQTNVKVWMED